MRITILTRSKEYSTDRVIDWLLHECEEFDRVNTDVYTFEKQTIPEPLGESYCYVRRVSTPNLFGNLGFYLKKEIGHYWKEYLSSKAKDEILGSRNIFEPYNIKTIHLAEQAGLRVPRSIITSCKKTLLEFLDENSSIITKPLVAPLNIINEKKDFTFRVAEVKKEDALIVNDRFYPTFFQEKITRDYEVRLFYIKGECKSMAFIVNPDNEDSPDIWNVKRRREVPIYTPVSIQVSVGRFMSLAKCNIGSLDFIICGHNWYFLELNPSGQYDFVSKSCNYYLDRLIAKTLINDSRQRRNRHKELERVSSIKVCNEVSDKDT